jgi:hypothetical protein
MFQNKCTTRVAAEARYGHIDFASRHWPEQSHWIRSLVIPEGMFPNWKVLNTKMPVRAIACNLDLHQPLMAALTAVHNKGLGAQLHTFDGCFNIRMVRGSNAHFSAHSYGLALDINAATNPMGSVLHTTFTADFVKCFTDQGFAWGGNFHGRKDPMHFSRCFEG